MGRRVVAGLLAVALAAAGTFVLVLYVRGAEERALAGQEAVDVLVVNEPIAEGTAAEDIGNRVETRQVTANVRAEDGVDDLDALEGLVVAVDLVPGEQLVAGRFVDPANFRPAGEVDLPEGHQVITVEQPPERVVGGQIVPGDTVGLIVSGDCETMGEQGFADGGENEEASSGECTAFLLHKVLVINVQGAAVPDNEDEGRDGQPGSSQMVSLAVDSGDAVRIAYAREHFAIWFTNEPDDAAEDGPMIQTWRSILDEVGGRR